MTGTDLCVNKPHKSRSYLNHPVHTKIAIKIGQEYEIEIFVIQLKKCIILHVYF